MKKELKMYCDYINNKHCSVLETDDKKVIHYFDSKDEATENLKGIKAYLDYPTPEIKEIETITINEEGWNFNPFEVMVEAMKNIEVVYK